ncbi:ribonuclease III [Nitzschia inconspicua]|uniref:Ribonuclease III n=1 Tax=Nitzschia inconspicua TaxID=303405 RepID=A0A9K3M3A5_9STRA|nr:ribonuclease III [Nitzschia inconspicua]KAG7371266.1 ribonuclease III [Nitzschia inconspicua]
MTRRRQAASTRSNISILVVATTLIFVSLGRSEGFCCCNHQALPSALRERSPFMFKPHFLRMADQNSDEIPSASSNQKTLLEQLSPMKSCKPDQMGGTDLAYIGDVVFELFIRSRCVWPSKRTSELQNEVVALVRAENQSLLLQKVKEKFELSEKERQILMRGRNAVTKSKNRKTNPGAYQDSTAFEALLGYLYITCPDRCSKLLAWLETELELLATSTKL